MKNLIWRWKIYSTLGALTGLTFVLSSNVFATPVCNATNPCEVPAATTQSTIVKNAGSVTGLQSLNSSGPNGNQANSNYYFAVTTTNQGSTVASLSNSGDGTTVIGVTPTHNANSTPSSSVLNGVVQGTKGGTIYFIYAQACPASTASNGTNCSSWGKVDTNQETTAAYPTSVFAAPQAPADATVNSITVRTAVPSGDVGNVSVIDLTIDDLITSANNQTLGSIQYTPGITNYTVDNTEYTNGFKPNTKYQYQGQVQYPWDLVPIAGLQTEGPFWTTPSNPGTVTATNVTHCSADITAQNGTGNPSYTEYSVCATAVCQTSARIGANPSVTLSFTNLSPGLTYTPNATALVGDQDGSQTGWNNSGVTNGTPFTTVGWGGSSNISNITTTSADYNFPGLDTSGVVSYQLILNGVSQGTVNNAPTSPIHLSGLNPNTQYTVALKLSESNCTSGTILSQTFDTLAAIPTTPTSYTNVAATTLTANWTDALNGTGTHYGLQHCDDTALTLNCSAVQDVAKVAGSAQSASVTGLTPEHTYFFQVAAKNLSGVGQSAYLPFSSPASVTTLDQAPTVATPVSITPNPVTGTTGALSVLGASWDGESNLTYTWATTGTPPAAVTFSVNGTNAAKNTTATFTKAGSYTVQVTITDPFGMTATSNLTFTVNQTPTAMSLNPNTQTVLPKGSVFTASNLQQTFTATVLDQFGQTITNPQVVWTVTPSGSVPTPGPSTTFTAASAGTFTLKGTLGAASASDTIVVQSVAKTLTISPNPAPAINGSNPTDTFTAQLKDEFNNNMTTSVNWSAPAGGTLSATNGSQTTFTPPNNGAGTYSITASSTNTVGDVLSVSENISVNQTPTTITISPAAGTTSTQGAAITPPFAATVKDQFGNVIANQAVTWTLNNNAAGTLSPTSGVSTTFTPNQTTPLSGDFVLTASLNPATPATAIIHVIPAGPFFLTGYPSAVLNSDNKTVTLLANANDNIAPTNGFTYTWTVTSNSPAASIVSQTTSGNMATATLSQVGTYIFSCTVVDSNGTKTAQTSPVSPTQHLSSIVVSPNLLTLSQFNSGNFTASGFDQFGNSFALSNVTWSVDSGAGNINSAGVFSASGIGENFVVTATQNNISGHATVNIVNYDVSTAYAYPVPYKSTFANKFITFTGIGSQSTIRIYTSSGRKVRELDINSPSGSTTWDLKNGSGENVASGVYFYTIESPGSANNRKDGKLIIIQ